MTKPINTDSIEKATDKLWIDWVKDLDSLGAKDLSHADLARLVGERLVGKVDNPGWWAQGITVAYEQHHGKRVPGQLADGSFELAVSKTVSVQRGDLFPRVVEWFESQAKLNNQDILKPRSSETPRRSTWRCDFADKSKFSATVEDNGAKSKLVLSHTAIPDKQQSDDWRQHWRKVADELVEL